MSTPRRCDLESGDADVRLIPRTHEQQTAPAPRTRIAANCQARSGAFPTSDGRRCAPKSAENAYRQSGSAEGATSSNFVPMNCWTSIMKVACESKPATNKPPSAAMPTVLSRQTAPSRSVQRKRRCARGCRMGEIRCENRAGEHGEGQRAAQRPQLAHDVVVREERTRHKGHDRDSKNRPRHPQARPSVQIEQQQEGAVNAKRDEAVENRQASGS